MTVLYCRRDFGLFSEAGLSRTSPVQRQNMPELIFPSTECASVMHYFFCLASRTKLPVRRMSF